MLFHLLAASLLSAGSLSGGSGPLMLDGGGPYPQPPVDVELVNPPPGQMYVEDLWRVRLNNLSSQTYSVYLFVTIERSGQGILMDATTAVFLLPPGIWEMSSADISPISTEFYDSDFQSSVSMMGGFPDGDYIVTIYVYEAGGGLLGSGGFTQNVVNHSPPELLYPADGETVTDPLPVFSWLSSMPSMDVDYDLRVVQVIPGQSPQSAIVSNPAWYSEEGTGDSQVPYPPYADPFTPGTTYAWQVEGFYQGVSIGCSQVWTFTPGAVSDEGAGGSGIWSFETGDRVYCSPAIAPDGSIICGSDDGFVYSLDESGGEQWRLSCGGPVYAVMTEWDGRVFAAGTEGVCCIDASGFSIWDFGQCGMVTACPMLLPDGTLLFGSDDGILYSVDSFQGTVNDTLHAGTGIRLAAAADDSGTVYICTDDGTMYALNVDGGLNEKWSFRVDEAFTGGPVLAGGRILAAAGRDVICWDCQGRQLWRSRLPSRVYTGPVVSGSGVVYAGTGSGNVYGLDLETGRRSGVIPAGAVITSTPALMVSGAMVFGCEDGRLHCFTPSGFSLWKFQTGDQVRSSPVIGMDGTVYFGSDDHRIWAVSGSGAGPMLDGWPQFCLDSFNNGCLQSDGDQR